MKAHQRVIRENFDEQDAANPFSIFDRPQNPILSESLIREIGYDEAKPVILKYEWLGKMPANVQGCYGLFFNNIIGGALVFAERPGSNLPSDKSDKMPANMKYLARGACANWTPKNSASFFISAVCRDFLFANTNGCVIAFIDRLAGEIGTIYQSLGWIYIGASSGGPSAYMVNGEVVPTRTFNRQHRLGKGIAAFRKVYGDDAKIEAIGRKERYIGAYGDKRYKREIQSLLSPITMPYPKRDAE